MERNNNGSEDHPRSRGVYPPSSRDHLGVAGSSPLARGLPIHERHGSAIGGIIPARAGFTAYMRGKVAGVEDHPRSRGVYAGSPPSGSASAGSSPLARGLRNRRQLPARAPRIIPARAGFTPGAGAESISRRDHPRSRGVYWLPSPPVIWTPGSSPLARGLHHSRHPYSHNIGIIPARAGFTHW